MSDFSLHLPINSVSFGQCSVAILREIYTKGLEPALIPIGQPDASCQKIDPAFGDWLNRCLAKGQTSHSRKIPVIKLWHIEGSLESFSEKQILYTFYELDSPTPVEINTVKNQTRVIVSNRYCASNFENCGVTNIATVPLGFDKSNFSVKQKKFYQDNRIVFNILGKFEKRKHHEKAIKAWAKKYGNNAKYFLNCAIWNPFFKPEDNAAIFNSMFGGKRIFNINFLAYMAQNDVYNDMLNNGHIVIAMSGAEGWGLGEFHSVALGKHCVGLNAHAHKDWMTEYNSVLVNPSGKIEAYDGQFFVKGRPFNQGNIFDWNEDEFIEGCEAAIKRYEKSPINTAGLELQSKFSYERTTNEILAQLEKI
jgi:glycosyltransferase involved in cell wall biosynthesis